MKNLIAALGICTLLFTSCGSSKEDEAGSNDTTLVPESVGEKKADAITGKLVLVGAAKLGQPINIKFSVQNNTDTVGEFCIWHTPFERLSSKYLDVALDDHTDVQYKGAMAKRVMPPPADSYKKLNAGDSVSVNFNLADGYDITKAGTYTLTYNASQISGVIVPDSLKIEVVN